MTITIDAPKTRLEALPDLTSAYDILDNVAFCPEGETLSINLWPENDFTINVVVGGRNVVSFRRENFDDQGRYVREIATQA